MIGRREQPSLTEELPLQLESARSEDRAGVSDCVLICRGTVSVPQVEPAEEIHAPASFSVATSMRRFPGRPKHTRLWLE